MSMAEEGKSECCRSKRAHPENELTAAAVERRCPKARCFVDRGILKMRPSGSSRGRAVTLKRKRTPGHAKASLNMPSLQGSPFHPLAISSAGKVGRLLCSEISLRAKRGLREKRPQRAYRPFLEPTTQLLFHSYSAKSMSPATNNWVRAGRGSRMRSTNSPARLAAQPRRARRAPHPTPEGRGDFAKKKVEEARQRLEPFHHELGGEANKKPSEEDHWVPSSKQRKIGRQWRRMTGLKEKQNCDCFMRLPNALLSIGAPGPKNIMMTLGHLSF
uniref:Uncharacterized protein n=1 Tax=Cannabis sativa TaxID=3483 RepID=A0A803P4N2_CANSA